MSSSAATCFFITPLGTPKSDTRSRAEQVYKHIVKRSLEGSPFDASWPLDTSDKAERITKEVLRNLVEAPLVVADLTDLNPNVFYELAIRHATGKPTIQIIQHGSPLPFDVQDISTPTYELQNPDSIDKCVQEIRKQIKQCIEGHYHRDVFEILTTQAALESDNQLRRAFGQVARGFDEFKELLASFETRIPTRSLIEDYRDEIAMLKALRGSGIISPYRNRDIAIQAFSSAIDAESSEVMVTGSSLLGLLQKEQYRELAKKLEHKSKLGIKVKILLTHPKVADLRAEQEGRKFEAIGAEVLKSLSILSRWEVPPEVRLYLGTPTIFAIKTKRKMLLNFYAYKAYAYESPCLIVNKGENMNYAYFYDDYDKAHFGAWDSSATEIVSDFESALQSDGRLDVAKVQEQFEQKIAHLQSNLPVYSERIAAMLREKDRNTSN